MTNNKKILVAAKKFGTPIYVYDRATIVKKCYELKSAFPEANFFYACKANTNPEIIKLIYKQGYGIETVSPGEIAIARKAGVPVSKIAFTCSNIDENELVSVAKQGIKMHLDSLRQVKIYGRNFPGKEISVRLNLHVGGGHHSHVITGGPESKFGIDISHINELKRLANKYKMRITGLQQHIGSNVLDTGTFLKGVKAMLKTALSFPDLKHLDFGGGFGVPYSPENKALDIKKLATQVKKELAAFNKIYGREVEVSFEPGRYLVAESGFLLAKVTDIKKHPSQTFVGINTGMNHLIRPAMYGSYHEILNISDLSGKKEKITLSGNICESGDVFAKNRLISRPRVGDILAITNTGAYGYAMSSNYNSRPRPKELFI